MEIIRSFDYDDEGEPLMVLRKRGQIKSAMIIDPRPTRSFAIRLVDAWMYSEEHNPTGFVGIMYQTCEFLCKLWDLGLPTPRKMAELATVIQEGIDELVNLPPQPTESKCIGEVTISVGSDAEGWERHTNDVIINVPIGNA